MSPELPATYNLKAYRGDTWSQTFRLVYAGTPVDLTTASVACWATVRDLNYPLTAEVTNPLNGEVTISMPDPPLDAGAYSYDLEVTVGLEVTTWLRGRLSIEKDVTNAA
jgi:hypothetical protein